MCIILFYGDFMDINFELAQLARRAKENAGLKQSLIETRTQPDPIRAFCDKCAELGYRSITPYELATAGDAFVAAMLRSVNGGGVDAPDGWNDFYEMFFDEIGE